MTEREIFIAALQNDDPAQRQASINEACAGQPELRRQVEDLLRLYESAGSFLQTSAAAAVATGTFRAVPEPTLSPEAPGTVIGPYKLLQQIGEGGMGVVWMAEQTQPVQRKVALKVVKPGMDSRLVIARFEAERQALAMMDHVNIARVFDGGATENGRPYFVMELVHGVPITKYCDDNHLTPRQRLELFVPVCQAIQHAHQKGIIHRDIKPTNVMVTLYDGMPVPKVIDFGVAKATEQKLTEQTLFTQYGTMVGTLEYMSPEQAEMSAMGVDTRSDIYSLGVLLYELLTGSTPLTHKRMKEAAYGEILRMIKEEEPPRPSTRLSDSGEALASISANRHMEPANLTKLVRGELDWIVMKTLEKDRNRRYETAQDFVTDVQRYLADEPVQACPPSVGYRLRKFSRRNRRALATTAFLVLVLLAALGAIAGTVGWAVRDRDARTAALEQSANLALVEAERLLQHGNYAEALSAAHRAEGLLPGGLSEALRARVQALQKDLAMVQRLEEIRLPRAVGGVEGPYDKAGAALAYGEAFRAYGIDVEALDPAEAAEQVSVEAIRLELTAALDLWALQRMRTGHAGDLGWRRILGVARAADPDPWRNQVRDALEEGKTETLVALSASPKIDALPPQTLSFLGGAIPDAQACAAFLRRAQHRHPDDFWINFQLAWSLERMQPQCVDEAFRFYTVASALRPRNAPAHIFLGNALQHRGAIEEAIAEYRIAIELQPDYGVAYHNLGDALRALGRLGEASAVFEYLIRLRPSSPDAYLDLAEVCKQRGQWDRAVLHSTRAMELKGKEALAREHRGDAYLHLGRWDQAAADLAPGLTLGPVDDRWTRVACLRLLGGDLPGYQELCRQMAKHLEAEETDATAYGAARVGALSPAGPIAASLAVRWAERDVAAGKNAWNLHVLGLANYRAGQFEQAIQRSEEALKIGPAWPGRILNWLLLAQAHQRLDRGDEAAQWLDKAVQWRDTLPRDGDKSVSFPTALSSQDWLEFLVLFGEARALVKGSVP